MNHDAALGTAIDLAKITLGVKPIDPARDSAEHIADFIEALTARLEKM